MILTRRNVLIGVAGLIGLALILLALSIIFRFGQPTAYPGGTVLTIISGEVAVQQTGQLQYQPARDGMTLQAGDRVKTGATSYAVITFFDGSSSSLDSGTEVVVNSLLRGRPGQASAIAIAVQQLTGRVWTRVAAMSSSASQFQLDTPAAVVLVHGTLLLTEVGANGATVVRCYEGAATVRAANSEVQAPQGTQVGIDPGQPPRAATPQTLPSERIAVFTSPEVWARVMDSSDRTTGFAPPGVVINQIPESISGLTAGPERRFEIPVTTSGEWTLILEGSYDGDYQVVVQGISDGNPVFTNAVGGSIKGGQRFIGKISATVQGGKLTGGQLGSFSVLPRNQVVGKFVVVQSAVDGIGATATAVAIKGTPTSVRTPTGTAQPTGTATATSTPPPTQSASTPTSAAATATRPPATTAPTQAATQPPAATATRPASLPTAPVPTATRPATSPVPTAPAVSPTVGGRAP